jgi:hypothetical protein
MAVSSFQDLPLADRDRRWDGSAAEKRVRAFTDAEDAPNAEYRNVHLWYDADNKDNFTAYKLLIADVVDDRLVAVPRGVMAAAGIMQGAHGGIDGVTSSEATRIRNQLAKYYKKMDETPPWED